VRDPALREFNGGGMEFLANSAALVELAKNLDSLQSFIVLLAVVISIIVAVIFYLLFKIVKSTVTRVEMRTEQMTGFDMRLSETEQNINSLSGSIEKSFEKFDSKIEKNHNELKEIDNQIFGKIDNLSNKFMDYLIGR
jgi:predicted PurR-regulated permease PerM